VLCSKANCLFFPAQLEAGLERKEIDQKSYPCKGPLKFQRCAEILTQHGGQETTITSFHTTLLHHGMILVGLPYTEQRLLEMGEITGGTPYGATTVAGSDGSRWPSDSERAIARFQGRHVAEVAAKLKS